METIGDKVLIEYKKGNICYEDIEGIKTVPINEFVKQPIEGMLYDLNRLEEIILTRLGNNWINDYALVKLLRYYHKENERLKNDKTTT